MYCSKSRNKSSPLGIGHYSFSTNKDLKVLNTRSNLQACSKNSRLKLNFSSFSRSRHTIQGTKAGLRYYKVQGLSRNNKCKGMISMLDLGTIMKKNQCKEMMKSCNIKSFLNRRNRNLIIKKDKQRKLLSKSTEKPMNIFVVANNPDNKHSVMRIGTNKPHSVFKIVDDHRYSPVIKLERNKASEMDAFLKRKLTKNFRR
ncbi:unnamed protein product [Moneuplotes crassus]|uniref:Uncharacterized protein n=1 Tax=Euplotes crassus TaxID=5936 RepID=A0AAD2D1K4_EUPCR|nr:unnamed protein product [Moneuplotes crassus]